jgi:hypothetical protein
VKSVGEHIRRHTFCSATVRVGLLGIATALGFGAVSANAQSAPSLSGVELTPPSTTGAAKLVRAKLTVERVGAEFPCAESEFAEKRPKSAPSELGAGLVMLDCERADTAHFGVLVTEFADLPTARSRFREAAGTIAGTASREDFLFKGKQAREFVMHTDRKCAWTRIVLNGRQMLILIGERMQGDCKSLEAETGSFFESLEFFNQ